MNILFTGASSFSGLWFVKELAQSGHAVTTVFQKDYKDYDGLRKERIDQLLTLSTPIFSAPFGSESFLKAIDSKDGWDLLCHHASQVANYKSPDFDVVEALRNNTFNIKAVLQSLKEKGCNRVILTGTVFEKNEGTGSIPLQAVSPYGLSKGLTCDIFSFYTDLLQMRLAKFVIPNPFGPYEETRFTSYLASCWLSLKTAEIQTSDYVRDNIPISLLAKAYVDVSSSIPDTPGFQTINPSYFSESVGAFTHRFSKEMQKRLRVPCAYLLQIQVDVSEPKIRINKDRLDPVKYSWNEDDFWDGLASYYKKHFSPTKQRVS